MQFKEKENYFKRKENDFIICPVNFISSNNIKNK
jgi:hypothetical protein